mmetsp:Transcript_2715/g.3847  ORF Transcript_2715/g.3847 Transcript_2715/m.3847 type:complete len:258 (-) Transcript_2715:1213-1986(-)
MIPIMSSTFHVENVLIQLWRGCQTISRNGSPTYGIKLLSDSIKSHFTSKGVGVEYACIDDEFIGILGLKDGSKVKTVEEGITGYFQDIGIVVVLVLFLIFSFILEIIIIIIRRRRPWNQKEGTIAIFFHGKNVSSNGGTHGEFGNILPIQNGRILGHNVIMLREGPIMKDHESVGGMSRGGKDIKIIIEFHELQLHIPLEVLALARDEHVHFAHDKCVFVRIVPCVGETFGFVGWKECGQFGYHFGQSALGLKCGWI